MASVSHLSHFHTYSHASNLFRNTRWNTLTLPHSTWCVTATGHKNNEANARHTASSPDRYTFDEFRDFTAAVVQARKCEYPDLALYGHLLSAYIARVPDLGWERCARQVWPLLAEVKGWVEDQKIPIDMIAVRPVFTANAEVPGGYTIRAYLCNHNVNGCDCGVHGGS